MNSLAIEKRVQAEMFGVWPFINSLEVVISLIRSKPDFIIFDVEHGYWDKESLALACTLCRQSNILPVIRVSSPILENIQLAYDCNPYAIQVSGLNTLEDFNRLDCSIEHHPHGDLGFSPWTDAGYAYASTGITPKPKIIPQVESRQSIEILLAMSGESLKNYFGIFLGRYDLSVDLVEIGEINSEIILGLLNRLVTFARKNNLAVATVSNSNQDTVMLVAGEVNWVSLGSDRSRISNSETIQN